MTGRGRVTDQTGAPVAGALVSVVASSVPFPEIALVTDAAGHFSISFPPGRFTLRASGPEGAVGEVEVDATAGTPAEIALKLGPRPGGG